MGWQEEKTSESHPIRVDFLPPEALEVPGRLGMTFAPGKKADGADGLWERNLGADLRRLREEYHVEVLVSLMERIEYSYLEIPDLLQKAEEWGMEVFHLPIPDGGVPLDPEADKYGGFIEDVAEYLKGGQTVVVHCRGGQGRSGMVAASVLVALGRPAVEALEVVRRTRKGAVETPEQEDLVHFFEMGLRAGGDRDEREAGGSA
jgi:protein-tyrosine phosphatase